MCGIAGFCNFEGDLQKNIERMKERMFHRGPDAGGTWISADRDVVFGHRRLAVIDLSEGGAQPMESHSGRSVMVFNGEIYNYKGIADRLLKEKKVIQFRGTSDTEVLLEAIEAYGIKEALMMCKGMFALAVFDKKERTLSLGRDRIGEKPLYYGFVGNSFVFASDIGSIEVLEDFNNSIDTGVLDIYFLHGYIPAPYSVYRGISKLEAGKILAVRHPYREVTSYSYWSMKQAALRGQESLFRGSREEAADELERLLKASIKEQMVADVPVGAFLSAGIDSSTIVALMQSLDSGRVRSFTIGMDVSGYNEAVYAKEIASHLGTEHTELYITEKDVEAVIPELGRIYGEPFADSSQIPTYLVSKMTREHVTVSLSGDGGDELFCGYNSYASVERIWNKMKNVPYFIRKPVSQLVLHSPLAQKPVYRIKGGLLGAKEPAEVYIDSYKSDEIVRKISLNHEKRPYLFDGMDTRFFTESNHNMMLLDMLMYHPDDILVKVDRAAMAVSLETRVPMLDKDVVEFAWSLPIAYKRTDGIGKRVLRDVLYRYVPKEMMERPKKGFSIPIDKWLKQPRLREWAEMLIDRDVLKRQGILDADVVWKIWNDFIEKGEWRIQIWYILMFQQWQSEKIYC